MNLYICMQQVEENHNSHTTKAKQQYFEIHTIMFFTKE